MKKVLIPCVLLVVALFACTTTLPTESMKDPYRMRVECRNDIGARQAVLFLLKQARAKDIKEDNSTGILVIEAAYFKSDNAWGVLQRIEDDLRRMPQVISVYIDENHSVIHEMH